MAGSAESGAVNPSSRRSIAFARPTPPARAARGRRAGGRGRSGRRAPGRGRAPSPPGRPRTRRRRRAGARRRSRQRGLDALVERRAPERVPPAPHRGRGTDGRALGDRALRELDDREDRACARAELEARRRRLRQRDELRRVEPARRDPAPGERHVGDRGHPRAEVAGGERAVLTAREDERRRVVLPDDPEGRRGLAGAARLWAESTPTYQSRRKRRRPASPVVSTSFSSASPPCTSPVGSKPRARRTPAPSAGRGRRSASPRRRRRRALRRAAARARGGRRPCPGSARRP